MKYLKIMKNTACEKMLLYLRNIFVKVSFTSHANGFHVQYFFQVKLLQAFLSKTIIIMQNNIWYLGKNNFEK
jgi:hypothetical protein